MFAPRRDEDSGEREREGGRFTEEPNILIEIHLTEECPMRVIVCWSIVRDTLIDSPGDVSTDGTIAETKGEERDLSRGIDQLKFQIRNTQTGDHTAKRTRMK